MKAIFFLFALVAAVTAQNPPPTPENDCLQPIRDLVATIQGIIKKAIEEVQNLPEEFKTTITKHITNLNDVITRLSQIIVDFQPFKLNALRKSIQDLVKVVTDMSKFLVSEGMNTVDGVGQFVEKLNAQLATILVDLGKTPFNVLECLRKKYLGF